MSNSFDDYRNCLNLLLLDFQWIEELLKINIASSYESIRRSKPARVSFKLNRNSLEKDSLGKLIQKYAEVSPNDSLVAQIRTVVKDRNYCAHQSYILTIEEQEEGSFLQSEIIRMLSLRERTRLCVITLQQEFLLFTKALQETAIETAGREVSD